MRDPINDELDVLGSGEASGRKAWLTPSLLRLDADRAENAATPGSDGIGSAS